MNTGIDLVRVHDVEAHRDVFNAMRLGSTQPENVE